MLHARGLDWGFTTWILQFSPTNWSVESCFFSYSVNMWCLDMWCLDMLRVLWARSWRQRWRTRHVIISLAADPICTNQPAKNRQMKMVTTMMSPMLCEHQRTFRDLSQWPSLKFFTDHELWTVAQLKLKHINKNRPIKHTDTHTHTHFRDLSMHVNVHTHNAWWCWWSSGSQRMEEDDGWKVFDDCVGWLLTPLYFHSQPQCLPQPSVSHPIQMMSDRGRICPLSILLFPSSWGVSNSHNSPPLPTTTITI